MSDALTRELFEDMLAAALKDGFFVGYNASDILWEVAVTLINDPRNERESENEQ